MGKCNKCGDCCRKETLEERIRVYEAFGFLHKHVNQNCKLFDPEIGLCRDYDNRPKNCRDFPTYPQDIIALPKCNYYFVLDGKLLLQNVKIYKKNLEYPQYRVGD